MCLAIEQDNTNNMENNRNNSSPASPPPSDLRSTSTPPRPRGDRSPVGPQPNSLHPHPFHGLPGAMSPRNSPPTLVPSTAAMSMASMASMLGHPPPFLHPGFAGGHPGRTPGSTDLDFMHKFMDRSFGNDSPPPTVPTNDPTANECKIVEYRGEKIAAFMINGKTMLCLPQAFELFLKHLVGGLHTVYTKLKRLEITPIVCNVEQVRILRGLGAIQPGVNRCKLLADNDFDMLYKDCTTSRLMQQKLARNLENEPHDGQDASTLHSRPGRPPKRGVPFPPMSPQDAMMHLKNMHNGAADPYKDGPFPKAAIDYEYDYDSYILDSDYTKMKLPQLKDICHYRKLKVTGNKPELIGRLLEPRLDKNPFGNGFGPPGGPPGLNPMAAQFMALQHPAFLGQVSAAGLPAPFGLPSPASVVTSSPSIPGRPEPQFMKGPNAASLASLEALQRSGFFGAAGAAYIERMREGQKSLVEQQQKEAQQNPTTPHGVGVHSSHLNHLTEDGSLAKRSSSRDSFSKDDRDSPILNLSNKSAHENNSDISAEDDVYVSDNEDDLGSNDEGTEASSIPKSKPSLVDVHQHVVGHGAEKTEDKVNNNNGNGLPSTPGSQGLPGPGLLAGLPGLLANAADSNSGPNGGGEGQLGSVYSLITNIQALIKVAVENAKKEERTKLEDGGDSKTDPKSNSDIIREFEELKKNSQLNLRRLKKEKRYRRKLQEQLEIETKRRVQMEEALRMTSAETLKRITESLSRSEGGGNNVSAIDANSVVIDSADQNNVNKRGSANSPTSKDRRDSGDDPRSSPASSSTSHVAIAAAAAAAAAAAQFNATVSTSEASSDRGTPPRDTNTTTTTLGFAKNLFPQYNASSLFTSAN